jgi:hypothetical protein
MSCKSRNFGAHIIRRYSHGSVKRIHQQIVYISVAYTHAIRAKECNFTACEYYSNIFFVVRMQQQGTRDCRTCVEDDIRDCGGIFSRIFDCFNTRQIGKHAAIIKIRGSRF